MREVVARTAVEPHSRAVLPSDNPKSVVLDLVQHWLPEGSCSVTEILYRVYDFLTHRDAHDPLPFLPSRCGPIAVAERSIARAPTRKEALHTPGSLTTRGAVMNDVFGLLAFAGLIAAQFLAVVAAYSERFGSDLRGGQQCATGTNRGMETAQTPAPLVLSAACLAGDGPTIFAHACKMGLEGIVSKRKDSTYRSGRSPDWLKMKNRRLRR
jgi:hypothetical protein